MRGWLLRSPLSRQVDKWKRFNRPRSKIEDDDEDDRGRMFKLRGPSGP
jgi:hypothetical protein